MSIKGTLETFNLCELLQMLAFNRKVGTVVLEADGGARTIYLASGSATFTTQDPYLNATLLRLARRHKVSDENGLQRAWARHEETGRHLAEVLRELRMIPQDTAEEWLREAFTDQLFDAQLTAVSSFEFVEERALTPDGDEGQPVEPAQPVDSLLLDLARQLDHWNAVVEVIPSPREVFEGTGIAVDLSELNDVDGELAGSIIQLIDGQRSLEEIAVVAHATQYAVTQVAAALFQGGGLRAVPTQELMARAEALLARGEAAVCLPMLRRCIERGDAPLDVRLRLADALEASGEVEEAASELDTYAALSDDDDAVGVFEALIRALRLRDGGMATAMRVCDFYLRRRPWLREYRTQATHALRDLIGGATKSGRPIDAAHRLSGFIQCGDIPSEDLVLLADLYAAGGQSSEAASALARRAEDLLGGDRPIKAREMLHRALQHDPGHADAKRRIRDLEGVSRRRMHKVRVVLLGLLLVTVVGGAAFFYIKYRKAATIEVGEAGVKAEAALKAAEDKSNALIAAFAKHVESIQEAAEEDKALVERADTLRREVRAAMSTCQRALAAYANEIESYTASGEQQKQRAALRQMEQRRHYMNTQATAVVRDLTKRARRALARARTLNREGKFRSARKELRLARNLAMKDVETYNFATQSLEHVDKYFAEFESYEKRMIAATERGDLAGAFQIGVAAVGELADSDLTRSLAFPLRVTSEPVGASVWIGSVDTGLRTPCQASYSPFLREPRLRIRMPGRTSKSVPLPAFESMANRPESLAGWQPRFHARLVSGPRWTATDPSGGFTAMWISGDVPVVVGNRGHNVYAVTAENGDLLLGARLDMTQPEIRMGGILGDGYSWHIGGQFTVAVQRPAAQPWVQQALGRIERRPLRVGDALVFCDEIGTVYAYGLADGSFRWKLDLGESPAHAPVNSKLGVLLATINGTAFRIDARTGEAVRLAPSARGNALAVPWGKGALFLGGDREGLRYIGPDGKVSVLGDAAPLANRLPWVGPEGVAWIEKDGVRWLAAGGRRPVPAPGLGRRVRTVVGEGGALVSCDENGVLRGSSLKDLGRTDWQVPLSGVPAVPPLVLGKTVYVLLGGRLLAIEI